MGRLCEVDCVVTEIEKKNMFKVPQKKENSGQLQGEKACKKIMYRAVRIRRLKVIVSRLTPV